MQERKQTPHRQAWQTMFGKPAQVLSLLILQILARVIAFAPFIIASVTGQFLSFNPEHAPAYGLVFSLPLYVLLVMPLRFHAKARMAQLKGLPYEGRLTLQNYFKWLIAAFLRLALVLPALVPLFAFCYLFYYYLRVPGFNGSLLIIHNLGALLGGTYPEGILIIFLAAFISLVLAGWAWLYGLPLEHQDVLHQGLRLSLKKARAHYQTQKPLLGKTVKRNILLFLPAFVGVFAILVMQVLSMPLAGTLVFDFLIAVSVFLTLSFPKGTLFALLVVLLVLWLPLLPLRKLALSEVLSQEPDRRNAP